MSYIIEKKNPLVLVKLTAKGREKLAAGELDWKFWSFGDSEVDYRYVGLTGEPLKVLKPKDMQPNLKTLVEKQDCSVLNEFSQAEKQVIECCVKNEAKERGFFMGDSVDDMLIIEKLTKTTGTVQLSQFNGSLTININTVDFDNGDYILFKIAKPNTGALDVQETKVPVLYLWYKIGKEPLSTIITVDRPLPYFSFLSGDTDVNFYIFPKGDSILEYYGSGSTVPYWNKPTLEFTSDCDISVQDVEILNQNNVWNETLAGTQANYEGHVDYGSIEYVGQKEYFGYNKDCPEIVEDTGDCEDQLLSVDDDFVKGIGIIHFSNLNLSNEYGEQYYINHEENNPLVVKMPTVMWHRRYFNGSTNGNLLGMQFVTTGNTKLVESSNIEYYDLVEDPTFINPTGTPISVGRVFPKLKVVVIHDEELLAITSYKSSRNFSLPKLKGRMIFPSNGIGTGVLPKNKTMYMTYALEAKNGLMYFLPHQKYIKFNNNSKIDRDIEFSLLNSGLLPYMRQFENAQYDGLGFYAHRFKVLVQIVDNPEDRPLPSEWKSIDYTSTAITNVNGYTINPLLLESQNSQAVGFTLTKQKYNLGSNYDLNVLNIPEINCDEELQFGDEVFLFGNMETNIGACIYRTLFKLNVDANSFVKTSNPTWDGSQDLWFNEVGIYDSKQELIAISKLSRPIQMITNSKFALEVSLDF